jgi:hypothetical protein
MSFDPPQVITDPDVITQAMLDAMLEAFPDWVAVDGDPVVALIEEIAVEVAATGQAAVDSIEYALFGVGTSVFNVPAQLAVAATIGVQVTTTAAGTIPAGFTVIGANPNGDAVGFALATDTPVAAGTTTLTLSAVLPGAAGNGVTDPLTVATASAIVSAATVAAASSGGLDQEAVADYLGRLVVQLSVLRFGGVRASDLAILARSVPGVYRATALDLYDPATPGTPVEKTVTVIAVDQNDQPVSSAVNAALAARLAAVREINFRILTTTPTYTGVTITYHAYCDATASPAAVQADIVAAVTAWLASWGTTDADPQAWVNTTTLRYFDAVQVIGAVPGVSFVDTLLVNGAKLDVTLSGAAPLPSPVGSGSTVTGTVDALSS